MIFFQCVPSLRRLLPTHQHPSEFIRISPLGTCPRSKWSRYNSEEEAEAPRPVETVHRLSQIVLKLGVGKQRGRRAQNVPTIHWERGSRLCSLNAAKLYKPRNEFLGINLSISTVHTYHQNVRKGFQEFHSLFGDFLVSIHIIQNEFFRIEHGLFRLVRIAFNIGLCSQIRYR